jgi:type IV secretion system protein TrbF
VHAMGLPLETETPSDSQITHFVARFVENIRSLSIDPIVVRGHWTQAYDYVTDHEAQILAEYTRNTNAFTQLGERSITVEVISVVRAAANSFEVRWVESTYRRATLMKVERFIGIAAVIFKMPTTADMLRSNPLGLYVDTFKWSADPIEEDVR